MSERLPYEEQLSQQWNDLPLPDENMAWDDMKRRLDEDDDKPLLPFWLRGCAGWAILGILVLALGWWAIRPEKWFIKNKSSETVNKEKEKSRIKGNDTSYSHINTDTTLATKNNDRQKDSSIIGKQPQGTGVQQPATDSPGEISPTMINTGKEKKQTKNTVKVAARQTVKSKQQVAIVNRNGKKEKKQATNKQQLADSIPEVVKRNVQTDSAQLTRPAAKKDTVVKGTVKAESKPDSANKGKKDTIAKKQSSPTQEQVTKAKTDSTKKKQLVFSTGIALQQQIPIAGQKFSPYNSLGRKGTWRDYIPSVYIRLTKPGKWFLQSGFRYGAPQYTKEFAYRQKIVPDTGANPRYNWITTSTLKKTYYHQLPLTFNYYVTPGFSVGAGIQLNKFVSAVTETELLRHDNFVSQDTVLSKFVEALRKDSATEFKKTYLQAIIETQYQWKRFSFGARYTFGLQPYIQFTLPGGSPQQERNHSLDLFIRYELWKSKLRGKKRE